MLMISLKEQILTHPNDKKQRERAQGCRTEPRNPPKSESQRNLIINLPLLSIIQLVSIHCIVHVSWILNLFKDAHHSVVNAAPIVLQHLAVISATLITPIICMQQIPAQNPHTTPTKSSLMKINN